MNVPGTSETPVAVGTISVVGSTTQCDLVSPHSMLVEESPGGTASHIVCFRNVRRAYHSATVSLRDLMALGRSTPIPLLYNVVPCSTAVLFAIEIVPTRTIG